MLLLLMLALLLQLRVHPANGVASQVSVSMETLLSPSSQSAQNRPLRRSTQAKAESRRQEAHVKVAGSLRKRNKPPLPPRSPSMSVWRRPIYISKYKYIYINTLNGQY